MYSSTFLFLEFTNATQTLISEWFKSFEYFHALPALQIAILLSFLVFSYWSFSNNKRQQDEWRLFLSLEFPHLHIHTLSQWKENHREKKGVSLCWNTVWWLLETTLIIWSSDSGEHVLLHEGSSLLVLTRQLLYQSSAESLVSSPKIAIAILKYLLTVLLILVSLSLPYLINGVLGILTFMLQEFTLHLCFLDLWIIPSGFWIPLMYSWMWMTSKQAIANIFDHWLLSAVTQRTFCVWPDKKAETWKPIWGELNAAPNGWHMYLAARRLPIP